MDKLIKSLLTAGAVALTANAYAQTSFNDDIRTCDSLARQGERVMLAYQYGAPERSDVEEIIQREYGDRPAEVLFILEQMIDDIYDTPIMPEAIDKQDIATEYGAYIYDWCMDR